LDEGLIRGCWGEPSAGNDSCNELISALYLLQTPLTQLFLQQSVFLMHFLFFFTHAPHFLVFVRQRNFLGLGLPSFPQQGNTFLVVMFLGAVFPVHGCLAAMHD
jgi:hypothetical protein